MRRTGSMTLGDLLGMFAVLVFAAGFSVAAKLGIDSAETRVRCAANLRMIGQALLLYSNDNKGAYPRTTAGDANNPTPVWGTPYQADPNLGAGLSSDKPDEAVDPFARDNKPNAKYKPKPNDVTAALYLLLRTQDVTGEVFVCPATPQDRWDFGAGANTALNWTNWQGDAGLRQHLSYSYQNPYPSAQAITAGVRLNNAIGKEFVVAADMNPGTDQLLNLTPKSPPAQMKFGNSPNHGRQGQNVLFGDGHVEMALSPFVGVGRDNIYTCGPSGSAHADRGGDGIVGSPIDANDTILLPPARPIGLVDAKGDFTDQVKPKPLTAAELADLRAKIVGAYREGVQGGGDQLLITADTITAPSGAQIETLSYEVEGRLGDGIRLVLSSPGVHPTRATIVLLPDGLKISGDHRVAGTWQRK